MNLALARLLLLWPALCGESEGKEKGKQKQRNPLRYHLVTGHDILGVRVRLSPAESVTVFPLFGDSLGTVLAVKRPLRRANSGRALDSSGPFPTTLPEMRGKTSIGTTGLNLTMAAANIVTRYTIFELGPDGYGQILDSSEPDRSYALRINQIAGICRAGANFETLEGAAVTFRLAGGQIEQLSLVDAQVPPRRIGVGR